MKNDVPKKNGAPANYVYHVIVSFIVDKEGNVTNVVASQDPGYGTAEEAVRVVNSSPKWEPAIQCNEVKKYRQRQQVSFEVL